MNKKTIAGTIAASLLAGWGCSAQELTPPKPTVEPGKVLVAYFSWGGNTKFAAQRIQKETGGTLFEIKPVKAYPTEYKACTEQAKKEIKDGVRPELVGKVDDMKKYEVIFVGSPNWWSTIAPPVSTFLASYDFAGKTIIPFVTHGGGGMAHCEEAVRKLCPKAKVLKGGIFSGSGIRSSANALNKWVSEPVTLKK